MKTNSRMIVLLMTMVSGNFVQAQTNLLPNGDFSDSAGISGWTAAPFSDVTFDSTYDADKSAESGSLQLGEQGSSANSTCFLVQPRATYSLEEN